jgi:Fur family transcriptional regulator, ferric uptake regulator
MAPREQPASERSAQQLLTSRNLRITRQRLVLLEALAQLRSPVSHAELAAQLKGQTLDRATVYRNLLSLTDAGLLVKTQLGDNVWRFELPRGSDTAHHRHPHFVCNDCGDVACLPSNAVSIRGASMRQHTAEIQLKGQCAECVAHR